MAVELQVSDHPDAPEVTPAPISEDDWAAATRLVQRARRLLLCSHKKPDGDAIGSLLGLGHALEHAGKTVTLACADPAPHALASLPGAARIVHDLSGLLEAPAPDEAGVAHTTALAAPAGSGAPGRAATLPWDVVICMDASGLDRLGGLYEAHRDVFERLPVIDLDHHFTNDRFGTANLVDPLAASATEVVSLLLERLGITPPPDAATCLLAGMMTDSLSFQTESTTPRTLRVAARLVEAGAPIGALAFQLFRQRPRPNAVLWSKALGTLQFAAGGRVAWIEVSRALLEESGAGAESGGLSGFAGSIEGVIVGMQIEEGRDGNVYAGFRSQTVDVAALAGQFGGGGHKRAAGCQFPAPATVADVRARLIPAVERYLADR